MLLDSEPTILMVLVPDSAELYFVSHPSWHVFLRMKTSSLLHLCQRSSLSPSCQWGRTGVWTQLWTNNGKKPENGWWQRSVLRPYGRTPPQRAQTASKYTFQRPKPASESKPAPFIVENTQTSITQTRWRYETDKQRMHRGWSLIAAQLMARGTWASQGTKTNPKNADLHPAAVGQMFNILID